MYMRSVCTHVHHTHTPNNASILRCVFFCSPESSCSGNTIVDCMSFFNGLIKWNPLHVRSSSHPLIDPTFDSMVLLLAIFGSV